MDEEVKTSEQAPEPEIKVSDYAKKFKSAEKVMRQDFQPKYELAKNRLRAELEVKGRGTRKLTHEQVDLTYSIGSNFVNSVYFKSPNVNLTAREEVDHHQIENTEIAVNDWLQDKKVKKTVKRSIWDGFLGGFGGVFTDYEYDDMEDPSNILVPAEIDPLTGQEIAPAQFGRVVLKNEITIQRLRPDLVRFPKGFDFDNFQDSPWIGFDLILPITEVKNNASWDEYVRGKIEGEKYSKLSDDSKKGGSPGEDDTDLYAKISYCFIKPNNPKIEPFKLLIFSSKCDEKPLLYSDFKKGHVGYPVKFIYFNPLDDDCSYPCGDAWLFESQLNAVDEWWKKVTMHVRRSNPKKIYDSGAITQQEVNKLKSNNDNEYVGVENKQQRDLRALVADLEMAGYPKDLDKMWEVARQLISEIAPKSSLSGGAGKTTDTATEAKMIEAGEVIDIDARIDDVKEFIKDIVLDVAGIMETSLAAPITVRSEIKLPPGVPLDPMAPKGSNFAFNDVGAEGFTSKINVDVDVESMQAQNKDVIRRQLLDMLGIFTKLGPFFTAIGEVPDPKWWIERIMETSNIKNIDKGFKPAIIPQVQPGQGSGPVEETITGEMPQEAVEAGQGQMV